MTKTKRAIKEVNQMADKAMIMPGAVRLTDRKVQYLADDMVTAYFAFRTLLALAR